MRFDLTSFLGHLVLRGSRGSEASLSISRHATSSCRRARRGAWQRATTSSFARSGFSLLVAEFKTRSRLRPASTSYQSLGPLGALPAPAAVPFRHRLHLHHSVRGQRLILRSLHLSAGGPVRAVLPPKGFLYWPVVGSTAQQQLPSLPIPAGARFHFSSSPWSTLRAPRGLTRRSSEQRLAVGPFLFIMSFLASPLSLSLVR